MEEAPYKNRELDEKFANLLNHMSNFEQDTKEALGRIEVQTIKTNGTVRWLTKMAWLLMGFCSCLAIIVLPLAWSLIQAGRL